MIFAENHWRHRDTLKEISENSRARAEDRSIAPFSKSESTLGQSGRKGKLLVNPAARAEIGRAEESTTKVGRGCLLYKLRASQVDNFGG